MTEIERECIRKIVESRGLPPEAVELDSKLETLQVDSLDRVSLLFDLEEQYGVNIPESDLQAIQTVRDVAESVRKAMAARASGASADQGAGVA